MRTNLLYFLILARGAIAGPVKRDCTQTICIDYINECNQMYGGCFASCSGMTETPTFTPPPCPSVTATTINTDVDDPKQTLGTASPSADNSTGSFITAPPSLITPTPWSPETSTCSPLWLCADYLAVCGDSMQMYGGCYDICSPAPSFKSPPCTLSSTVSLPGYAIPTISSSSSTSETGYAVPTISHAPGSAYTEKPASDDIAPAIDNNRAMVMAEMPSAADAPAPAPSFASELRLANAPDQAGALIEAPANLRGAAIAKMMADTVRMPTPANTPCYDNPFCKEVQLGISSPVPATEAPATFEPTPEPSAEPTTETSAETPAAAPTEGQTEVPVEAPVEQPAGALTAATSENSAEAPVETPAETSIEVPVETAVEAPAESAEEAPVEGR